MKSNHNEDRGSWGGIAAHEFTVVTKNILQSPSQKYSYAYCDISLINFFLLFFCFFFSSHHGTKITNSGTVPCHSSRFYGMVFFCYFSTWLPSNVSLHKFTFSRIFQTLHMPVKEQMESKTIYWEKTPMWIWQATKGLDGKRTRCRLDYIICTCRFAPWNSDELLTTTKQKMSVWVLL